MAHYLSGPPGGRTLPLTSIRLSDLAGGIYGPGASVASTGLNSRRATVRAADRQAAGETSEDIIEYYRVRLELAPFGISKTETFK
jgi:SEL1 protein